MIDPAAIFDFDFGNPQSAYTERDAILYALGVGLGADPLDREALRFLDERALAVLPSYAVVLCTPGFWLREPKLGVDYSGILHFAQDAEFPAPLPPSAQIRGDAKVLSLTDRGEGRGAILVLERRIFDSKDDRLLCRLRQTLLLRNNGGFGGAPTPRPASTMPEGAPDLKSSFSTSQRSALIYRLSGDYNPLHFDPDVAGEAGFSRPILHGLASYGVAGWATSQALGKDAAQMSKLSCRFSGIVLPGDTLDFSIWSVGTHAARFVAHVGDRKVLDGGEIAWHDH